MARPKIRKTRAGDAALLLLNLRDGDFAELKACAGDKSIGALVADSIEASTVTWSLFADNGKLLCVFGIRVADDMPQGRVGIPWLLGTKELESNVSVLLKYGPRFIHAMKKVADGAAFYNMVHSKNNKSIRWLRWLGFNIYQDNGFDVNGHTFYPFGMEACHV